MRLIIGGAGQGKLDYALNKTGADPAAVALDPAQAADRPILARLEAWVQSPAFGRPKGFYDAGPGWCEQEADHG